ncbi:hypothetical protein BKK79_12930 [Cupriavidus sp. USMAA2-4]|uniref:hypothetical protein n=1 Tax=unclassified Cupriavidus TaxID=2640874 RepID=UPI0008A7168D|nr:MULTISPECIES: hypothetical protein [unclassified Cupriavidus]AOY92581.1 hypothetical protein BKK79_12930 [Cupriavidus sp. USMAA2-4]AOZ00974.1 hypothetical protein BKK81_18260 [Cupriavidus sp. USMAHM13]
MRLTLAGLAAASLMACLPAARAAAPAATPAPSTAAASATAAQAAPAGTGSNALAPVLHTLEIGNPIPALPDCADKRTPDGRDVTAYCVELRGDGVMRQIGVPRDKRPSFMDGTHVVAFVDGNALVGLIVPTTGTRGQQAALESLVAGYGKPLRQREVEVKDRNGKPLKTVHAAWVKAPLTVELYAIPEEGDEGTIEMLLPQARKLMTGQSDAMAKQLAPASAPAAKAAPEPKAKGKAAW